MGLLREQALQMDRDQLPDHSMEHSALDFEVHSAPALREQEARVEPELNLEPDPSAAG